MNNKNGGSPFAAMVLMAMAAVCLAVFSMLAMASARSHKALSDACLRETACYYSACLEAGADLAALREAGGAGAYNFTYMISDKQELRVSYNITEGGSYEILEWATYPAGEWDEEEFIEVIQ